MMGRPGFWQHQRTARENHLLYVSQAWREASVVLKPTKAGPGIWEKATSGEALFLAGELEFLSQMALGFHLSWVQQQSKTLIPLQLCRNSVGFATLFLRGDLSLLRECGLGIPALMH